MFGKSNLKNMCGCDSVTDKQYKHKLNCGCDNENDPQFGGGDMDIENHLYPNDEQYSPFSDIDDSPSPVYNDSYDKAMKQQDLNLNQNQNQTQNQTGGNINNLNINLRRDISERSIVDNKLVGKTIRQLKYMKSKYDYLSLFD